MTTHTVRISKRAHYDLKELAAQFDESMQTIIEEAVDEYKRKRLFEKANIVYAKLRADPAAWEQINAERLLWERSIADGLEKE